MIIILEKSEIDGNRISAVQQAPLKELDILMDISSSRQLPMSVVDNCMLLIVTDKYKKQYRVMKDRFDISGIYSGMGPVFPLEKLPKLLEAFNELWLGYE